jgi:tRNA (cmo5U34)-methyltransferase
MSKDLLFKNKEKIKGKFNFNERTASVFDDMLRRSVPFYPEIQRMIVELAEAFVCSKSNVYDLGCSTGTTLVNLARHIDGSQINIIGMDSSEAMLKRARIKLNKNEIGRAHV